MKGLPGSMCRAEVISDLSELWYREGFHSHRSWVDVLPEKCAENALTRIVYVAADGAQSETTVGEIYSAAEDVASALRGYGIGSGDSVAVQLPNCFEASVAYVAVLLAGAVLVPIVHVYGPNEVQFILEQSEAKLFIQPNQWRSINYGDRVGDYRDIVTLERIVVVGDDGPDGCLAWSDLSTHATYTAPAVHADDIALLIYTSGTTAAPKGVQHSHNSLLSEVRSASRYLRGRDDSVQLVSFPPGHIAGVSSVLRPLVHGWNAVYMQMWDPELAVELISSHRVTATGGTPFHLAGILDVDGVADKLTTLSDFLIGASTVPEDLVRRAQRVGIATFRCYGSTEHPTATSGGVDDPEDARLGTDGAPMDGVRVRVVDELGIDVPVGGDGEIILRGPDQFVGYRDSSLNAEAFTEDGWMRTGDLGHLDVDGRLTITDRMKDVVIRAGETMSSGQIEDVLVTHPAIREGAIVAAADERYGEVVAAVVVLSPGMKLELAGLREHFAASGLARVKTPERLVVVDELPRTALGKIRKAELRSAHFT
ncbi:MULTISPECIES: AMP-binding protein [Rhodococcus]|uniref:AMP-binding protein n=1 Tax=Rhodococcus TaxID=1827 RepID=UPI001FD077DD|nr:AMP-binding protein [Rhodococcus globerulus]